VNKKTTKWVEYTEHNARYRFRVKYGFEKLGDQEPHFYITGTEQRMASRGKWSEISGGTMARSIKKHFPELKPLLRWHSCFIDSGPLHYVANAKYWASIAAKLNTSSSNHNPVKGFKSTVAFGAVEGDALPWKLDEVKKNILQAVKEANAVQEPKGVTLPDNQTRVHAAAKKVLDEAVAEWCNARFDALMKQFSEDTKGIHP